MILLCPAKSSSCSDKTKMWLDITKTLHVQLMTRSMFIILVVGVMLAFMGVLCGLPVGR